jgi:hypothetical protein
MHIAQIAESGDAMRAQFGQPVEKGAYEFAVDCLDTFHL